jgi:hypothetical protein
MHLQQHLGAGPALEVHGLLGRVNGNRHDLGLSLGQCLIEFVLRKKGFALLKNVHFIDLIRWMIMALNPGNSLSNSKKRCSR